MKLKFYRCGIADGYIIEIEGRPVYYSIPFTLESELASFNEPFKIRIDAWGNHRVVTKWGDAKYRIDYSDPDYPVAFFESEKIIEYPGKDDWKLFKRREYESG